MSGFEFSGFLRKIVFLMPPSTQTGSLLGLFWHQLNTKWAPKVDFRGLENGSHKKHEKRSRGEIRGDPVATPWLPLRLKNPVPDPDPSPGPQNQPRTS